eukprot:scaffold137101_cov15-Prasinocladus_malaysianus.AAC.2
MHSMRQWRLDIFVKFSSYKHKLLEVALASRQVQMRRAFARDLIVTKLKNRTEAEAYRGMSSEVVHVYNLGIKPASRRGPSVRHEGFGPPM